MHTVTRRCPNGVPAASPASMECRTGFGAALLALRWSRAGYVVELTTEPLTMAAAIRRGPSGVPG